MLPVNLQLTDINGYRILERIGIGGMGEVYKAFNPTLNRMAAVKILFQKEHAERFRNEAYIQSSVTHPNIARLYEYISSGHTPCIIMEYVEGTTLDSFIHKKGRLKSDEAEKILLQIVSALKYLHGKNIIHRDIKPSNFKVEKDGIVKMLDFGIAKNQYTPKLTQMGFVVGTTEYMAPEQFEQKVEEKSDVWSLGVMTYEMLTGELPFESNNPITLRSQIMKAKFTDPKIFVPGISEKLSELIASSLKYYPANRSSAEEIEKLLKGKQINKNFASRSISIPVKPLWVYGSLFVAAAIVLLIIFSSKNNSVNVVAGSTDTLPVSVQDNTAQDNIKLSKVKLAVTGVPNATIVFPDGSSKPAPVELTGKPGDGYDVIIQAEGYLDKPVHVAFLQTQSVYTETLDKKTNN
jgi:serine/threonine-protein kinase